MCGICGAVSLVGPAERELVERMMDELAHRGPDGTGTYVAEGVALGHRRLAIIDLTDAGLQPFASADGALQLLHNGEIYNYRELRRQLESKGHRFRSATDTEVIVAAYREWGTQCVERFNGMWAFALWDNRERRLFCSRDRFGVKPFYYRWDGRRFVFASELKAFRADPQPLRANEDAVADYVEQGYLGHTDSTFFSGIESLPAAHSLTLDDRGLRLARYWRLEEREAPQDPVAALRELFLDSVRLRLRSDVPVGTALSGGLDSSSIACAVALLLEGERENAAAVGPQQRTFTAYFQDAGFDERPFARAVIDRTRAAPEWISFSAADIVDRLPSIVETQDEPFGSTSIIAQWHVMQAAKQAGVKVMLDGQGGDEILAGYPIYWGARFADLLAAGRLRELARELGAYRRTQGAGAAATMVALLRPFLPARAKWHLRARRSGAAQLLHPELRGRGGARASDPSAYHDRLRRTLHLILTRRGLPELLRYEDRNSMAHSIEARVPFLDYRLAELLFSLDGHHLIRRGRTKAILRDALHDVLPPIVRDRTDKLGFVTPEARFMREELGAVAQEVFASRSFAERGFVDAAAARNRLERHRRGELDAGFELWRALNLELWARTFLDG
jgi:asparagine synthase (glutamine-hydrolysing)